MGPRGAKGEDPALPGLCGHLAPRALATAGHSAPPNPAASCPSALVEAGGWGHLELGPRARRLGPETPYVASSLTHCVPREEPPSHSEPRVLSRGAGMSCLRPRCSPSPRVCSSSRSGSECSSPAPPRPQQHRPRRLPKSGGRKGRGKKDSTGDAGGGIPVVRQTTDMGAAGARTTPASDPTSERKEEAKTRQVQRDQWNLRGPRDL